MRAALSSSPPRAGLSSKLLALTVLFVMLAEVLIYVPSIANFSENWLSDRLGRARAVALVLDAAPSGMVPESLTRELLDSVDVDVIVLKKGDVRSMLALHGPLPPIAREIDLRKIRTWTAIHDAFETLFWGGDGNIRVVGNAPMDGEYVEIVLNEAPLRAAMLDFSQDILLWSLIISGVTAGLVYLSLNRMIVRPIRRVTHAMMAFGEQPGDAARIIAPSARADEIGVVERELAAMQQEIHGELQSKAHLAALGLAVSKINHDLRNLLASAQLVSERFGASSDPMVRRQGDKLLSTLQRAISYCEATLTYGRAQEPPPERRFIPLADVVDEVRDALGLAENERIEWSNAVARDVSIDADPEQLFRILLNLGRNALHALEVAKSASPQQIRIAARREGAVVVIEVSDTGPGLPGCVKPHLFAPFHKSSRPGGTGLGLAIAAELVRAHGGEISLVEGTIGATFRLTVPDRPTVLRAGAVERQRA